MKTKEPHRQSMKWNMTHLGMKYSVCNSSEVINVMSHFRYQAAGNTCSVHF